MTDNVDTLLTQVQEQIENGRKLGRQRLVDPQELQDLLESVRAALPNTIERAKEIVARRSEILDQAREDADAMVANARQKAAETEADASARVLDQSASSTPSIVEIAQPWLRLDENVPSRSLRSLNSGLLASRS